MVGEGRRAEVGEIEVEGLRLGAGGGRGRDGKEETE